MQQKLQAKQKLISLRNNLKSPDYYAVDPMKLFFIIEVVNNQIEKINWELTQNPKKWEELNQTDQTWDNAPF